MPNRTIIQVPVGLTEILFLNVAPLGGGDVGATATYIVKTNNGTQIGGHRATTVILTTAQKSSLVSFLSTAVLPDINTAEGT